MFVTRYGVASLIAIAALAGCSGDKEQAEEQTFAVADAKRLAAVRPLTPGWPPWPQKPTPNSSPDGSEEANKWEDDDKLANLVVQVWGSEAKARAWMPEFNALSRQWGGETGFITKDEAVDDLGDEAWRLWVEGSGTQVTYHWRRGNLVLEAHVHCYGDCPSEVDAAARAWADAIDAELRAT